MKNVDSLTSEQKSSSSILLFLRKTLLSKVKSIKHGSLVLTDPICSTILGDTSKELKVEITVNNLLFYRLVALKGALGASEAYIKGYWHSDNLPDVIRLLVLNQKILEDLEKGMALFQKPVLAVLGYLTRNTLQGSKDNIKAHYDLSNELFHLFLDKNMMYSSAVYPTEDSSLEVASINKLDRICKKLELKPSDHLLEIGTGWGGFAIYAAKNYGCRVTTTTISDEQFAYAEDKVLSLGLSDRIDVIKKDYRELEGKFDKIVSIEMIEAVGADFLDTYLKVCSDRLKDNGMMLIQAITINDQIYDRALKEIDFIKKYIFPGSFIPSVSAIIGSMKDATDLRLYNLEDITPHYAKTLSDWRNNFLEAKTNIIDLGFDENFIRMWDYYFSYCIGGFMERSIGSVQLVFAKPMYRGDLTKIVSWN